MQAEGLVFLAKSRPLAGPAANGTFQLSLMVMDRQGPLSVEPWRITWTGEEAHTFWTECNAVLTPGQPLRVSAHRIRAFNPRHGAPEIHAIAQWIKLAPRSNSTTQPQAAEA